MPSKPVLLTINDNTTEYDNDVDNLKKNNYENSRTINLKKNIIFQIPRISNIIRQWLKNWSKNTRKQMGWNVITMNECLVRGCYLGKTQNAFVNDLVAPVVEYEFEK